MRTDDLLVEAVRELADLAYYDRWEQAKLLIEQCAPLLSEQALTRIAQRMEACDMEDYYDTMERDNLEDLYRLLSRCRAEGVGPALDPLIERERRLRRMSSIPMAARIRLLGVQSSADLSRLLADYPALAELGVAQDLRDIQLLCDVLRCAEQPDAGSR